MQAVYVILAWLLGLLSSPIVSRIEKYYRRKDIKKAIFSELRNLVIRLALTCYRIQENLGINDKSTLRWIKNVCEKYPENYPQNMLDTIDKILQIPCEQFDAVAGQLKASQSIGLALKTFSLPFTETVLEYLSLFDSRFQNNIFEVREQISMLNEEIDSAIFYFRLTFNPSCMDTNADIVDMNIKKSYGYIQERGRIIADKIDKILQT